MLMCLTLLSAHGAHRSWHRGPLWTVEPPLLEGQVRQSFSEPGPRFCGVLLDNAVVLYVCVSRDSGSDHSHVQLPCKAATSS